MTDSVRLCLRRLELPEKSHITVALSGGKDSVVLTEVLLSLRQEFGFTLSAVHVHHGLRAASEQEMQWVIAYCKKRELELECHRLDLSSHKGESTEMAARRKRYEIFAEYISPRHFVATAHHLDDCMETFFINLMRGCGSKGLTSIPYRRDGLIRPLLDTPKEEIDEYARRHHLGWVEDESNGDTYYLRNFLRHCIIPELKKRQDVAFTKNFAASLGNLREENELLEQMAAEYKKCDDALTLSRLPSPLLWRVLKARCEELTRQRFEVIRRRLGEDFTEQIKERIFFESKKGRVRFFTKADTPPLPLTPLESETKVGDKIIQYREIHNQFTHFDIDCATIDSKLFVRSRQPGDQIALAHRGCTKTVARLFSEYHIENREQVVLIADKQGRIYYIEGFGAADFCAPTKHTKKALRMSIKQTEENENEVT